MRLQLFGFSPHIPSYFELFWFYATQIEIDIDTGQDVTGFHDQEPNFIVNCALILSFGTYTSHICSTYVDGKPKNRIKKERLLLHKQKKKAKI